MESISKAETVQHKLHTWLECESKANAVQCQLHKLLDSHHFAFRCSKSLHGESHVFQSCASHSLYAAGDCPQLSFQHVSLLLLVVDRSQCLAGQQWSPSASGFTSPWCGGWSTSKVMRRLHCCIAVKFTFAKSQRAVAAFTITWQSKKEVRCGFINPRQVRCKFSFGVSGTAVSLLRDIEVKFWSLMLVHSSLGLIIQFQTLCNASLCKVKKHMKVTNPSIRNFTVSRLDQDPSSDVQVIRFRFMQWQAGLDE